jgi:hypothetical protein
VVNITNLRIQMMKKITCSFLLILLFAIDNNLFGQQMTNTEITEYMCKYKWFLRRYEWKDKFFTTPKEYQGTYLVFLPQGKMYYHKKGEKQSDQTLHDWKLSGDRISFTTHEGIKGTFKSNLQDYIGYKIYISEIGGKLNGLTYVWERAGEVQDEDRVGSKNYSATIPEKKQSNGHAQLDAFSKMIVINPLFTIEPLQSMEWKAISPVSYADALKELKSNADVKRTVRTENKVNGECFQFYNKLDLKAELFFDEAQEFCYYNTLVKEEELQATNKALKEKGFIVQTSRKDNGASTDTWKKEGFPYTIIVQYAPGSKGAQVNFLANSFLKNSKVE